MSAPKPPVKLVLQTEQCEKPIVRVCALTCLEEKCMGSQDIITKPVIKPQYEIGCILELARKLSKGVCNTHH
jgi:hypothetical protein